MIGVFVRLHPKLGYSCIGTQPYEGLGKTKQNAPAFVEEPAPGIHCQISISDVRHTQVSDLGHTILFHRASLLLY